MKKISITGLLLLVNVLALVAQSTQAFRYQAVLRDNAGNIMAGKDISIRVTLLKGSPTGTAVYSETQAVHSNAIGQIALNIGEGTTSGNFSTIDWSTGDMYLKIEIDPSGGSNYQALGTSKLLSVPYALYAKSGGQGLPGPPGPPGTTSWVDGNGTVTTSANVGIGTATPNGKLIVAGDASVDPDSDLFEVRNRQGETVFAVYEDGVRIYIPDNAVKGGLGGFAVGGRTQGKGAVNDIFSVYPDSVRVILTEPLGKGGRAGFAVGGRTSSKSSVNDILTANFDSVRIYVGNPAKGGQGGFAVGGRTPVKGAVNNILTVDPDSVRVYIPGTISKGGLGGFAVGGRTTGKGGNLELLRVTPLKTEVHGTSDAFSVYSNLDTALSVQQAQIGAASYMRISPNNFFIGQESGLLSTSLGKNNSFVGYQSGKSNSDGAYNVFLGYQTGFLNDQGSYNVLIGWQTGYNSRSSLGNVFIGAKSGFLTYGEYNTCMGSNSGANVYWGRQNAFFGMQSGMNLENGENNTFLGSNAGFGGAYNAGSGETGNNNTFVGFESGHFISNGNNNTMVGDYSGYSITNGSGNVFIGHEAGKNETTNSTRLYIANSAAGNPLVFGEFDSARVVINGNKTNNLSKSTLFVNGTSGGTNAWASTSDGRLKTNVVTIDNALAKVMRMRGVNFEWKKSSEMPAGKHMGFIAQEVLPIIPEVVNSNGDYYSMEYAPITALLLEAIKEQQKMIEDLKAEVEQLKKQK